MTRVVASRCNDAHRCQRFERAIIEFDRGVRLVNRIEELVFVLTFWVVGTNKATTDKTVRVSRWKDQEIEVETYRTPSL